MEKVAVIYWSGTGNTEMMAKYIAEGVKAAGGEADVFSVSDFPQGNLAEYGRFALGCPAMGAEELEDSEFQPFYDAVKPSLAGKKVALFGSYGWGGGEWMNPWKADAEAAGLILVAEPLAIESAPDEAGKQACADLGKALLQA
jgi:flavodoxin short chain